MVERVCDCDLETEEVQLQVIKALVHACTATTLAVHQASLLTAVKTIYTVCYTFNQKRWMKFVFVQRVKSSKALTCCCLA